MNADVINKCKTKVLAFAKRRLKLTLADAEMDSTFKTIGIR